MRWAFCLAVWAIVLTRVAAGDGPIALLSLVCFAPQAGQSAAADKPTGHDSKFGKMSEFPKNLLTGQVFKMSFTLRTSAPRVGDRRLRRMLCCGRRSR
jgi:hypothetical protein